MRFNRRKFLKISASGLAAAGAAGLVTSDWLCEKKYPGDAKKIFSKCGTCSQTFFCLLNREFGHPKPAEEFASDPLAGGLMSTQHQCGMLWGATLATGAESFRRFDDESQAITMAVTSAQHIAESFSKTAKTLDCRDIVGFEFQNKPGMIKFMLLSLPGGFSNMVCMDLAEKWAPDATKTAKDSLKQKSDLAQMSCASEVAKKIGANKEQVVTVAGLAGGIGLSGHACGALGAAIWISSLDWCRKHPGESGYLNPKSKEILNAFNHATKGEMLCSRISGKEFKTAREHTEYIKNGGCGKLMEVLSKVQ